MKKIPTLFVRTFDENHNKSITTEVTPGMEWVVNGMGYATLKIDGSCCAIRNGKLYKRYDAKQGKKPPEGAIPCCEPDPITGHWPHWVEVVPEDPGSQWFLEAYRNTLSNTEDSVSTKLADGTYEAIGPHFQSNPYCLEKDMLVKHGTIIIDVPRCYEGIKQFLKDTPAEGLVFWENGEPKCKIKRSDFGYKWPEKEAGEYLTAIQREVT